MPLSSTWESLTWASAVASSLTAQPRQVAAQLRLRLLVHGRRELADLAGQHDQIERADRRRLGFVADAVDGPAHAGDAFAQALPERPQLAAVVGHRIEALAEDRDDVEQAVEVAFEEGGRRHRPFVAGCRHGDQVTGEVAAVDARHVERMQRPQRRGFVPVVEMAAIGLQLLDRGDGGFQPLGGVGKPDPAEIARRQYRQQIDADIGRRCARGDHRGRKLLEIVRRQHVVLGRDEGLEIEPGPPPVGAQPGLVRLRHDQPVLGLRRAADQPCESRRADPEQRKDERDAGTGRAGGKRDGKPCQPDQHGPVHHAVVADQRVVAGPLRLRGGAPLQQVAAADLQPVERAHDRIAHQPRRMGDQHDPQRHLRRGKHRVAQQRAEMAARSPFAGFRDERVDDVEGRRHEQHQHEQRLELRGKVERQCRPPGDRRDHPGDRRQRAPQIVDHLPARQRRDRAAPSEDVGQQLPVAARPAVLARRVDVVAGRVVLDQLDVADQRGVRQRAFEKVVAQHFVLGKSAPERGFHGIDVVHALAGEGAVVEHVLVEVGHRKDIRVETAIGREDALEERGLVAGGQRRRHAGCRMP